MSKPEWDEDDALVNVRGGKLNDYTVEDEEDEDEGKAEIIVAKQRNGPTGKVNATFIKQYARFENLSEEQAPF